MKSVIKHCKKILENLHIYFTTPWRTAFQRVVKRVLILVCFYNQEKQAL